MYIRKKKILAGGGRDGPKRILSLLGIVLVLSGTMVTSIFPTVSVSAAENTEISADAVHEHEDHYHSDDGTVVYYDDAEYDVSVAAADAVTVIDVTGLAAGEETSHDCQKYLTTKYDDNNHWQECTVCGNKYDVEKHVLNESGNFSCHWSSQGITASCECGYSKHYKKKHNPDTSHYYTREDAKLHYYLCKDCGSFSCDDGDHPEWYEFCIDENGDTIKCNGGTCVICGATYLPSHTWYASNYDESGNVVCENCGEILLSYKKNKFKWTETTSTESYFECSVIITSWNTEIFGTAQDVAQRLKISSVGYVFPADWTSVHTEITSDNQIYAYAQGKFEFKDRRDITPDVVWQTYSELYCPRIGIPLNKMEPIPPQIESIIVRYNSFKTGWACNADVDLIITDNNNYTPFMTYAKLYDENKTAITDWYTCSKNSAGQYNVSIPIVGEINGEKTYYVQGKDSSENLTELVPFTISNLDSKIPSITSSDATATDWSKSKDITFTATDEGSGNVQIAFNKADEYAAAIKNSNTYSRRYRLVGDVYGSTQAAIYYKDLVGNETTGFVTISNIDNTAPTITKADLSFGDTVTLTVNANDNKDFGGPVGVKSGSGVVSYAISTDKNNPGVFQKNSIFTIPATGDYYVFARDAVGNIGMYHYGIITMSYDVTYNANGGTGIMNKGTAVYGRSFTIVDSDFTKTGYSFSGWNTRADGSGTGYDAGDVINPYKNRTGMTLYAQWKSNKYTITFNLNKPVRASSIPVLNARATMEVEYDAIITGLPDKTVTLLTGWTFAGWYTRADGGTEVKSGDVYNWPDNITLYAHWIENTYVVHYNSDGGTASQDINVKYEEPVTLLSAPFRPGYSFLSWNTRQDGLGTSYSASQSVTHLTTGGTVNLYGMWDRKSLMKIGAAVNTTVNNGYVFGQLSDESSVPVRTYIIDENGTIQK